MIKGILALLAAVALVGYIEPTETGGVLLLMVIGWCVTYLAIESVWFVTKRLLKLRPTR